MPAVVAFVLGMWLAMGLGAMTRRPVVTHLAVIFFASLTVTSPIMVYGAGMLGMLSTCMLVFCPVLLAMLRMFRFICHQSVSFSILIMRLTIYQPDKFQPIWAHRLAGNQVFLGYRSTLVQ